MRVFLLNRKTGLYLESQDSWTANPERAKDLGTSHRANVYAQDHCLEDLEIFLDFGNEEYNVHLPVELNRT